MTIGNILDSNVLLGYWSLEPKAVSSSSNLPRTILDFKNPSPSIYSLDCPLKPQELAHFLSASALHHKGLLCRANRRYATPVAAPDLHILVAREFGAPLAMEEEDDYWDLHRKKTLP